MLRVLNLSTDSFFAERERAAAREFSEEAAAYLPSSALLDFISCKIEDDECRAIILNRRTLINRMQNLAAPILVFFGDIEEQSIGSVLSQLSECYADYHFVEASPYASVQRKTVLNDVQRLIDQLDSLDKLLDKAWRHVDIEHETHKRAIQQVAKGDAYPVRSIDQLRDELRLLRFSADLALYKDAIGERAFFTSDNKARTHIVETAYRLSLQFDTPQLVTTPGSDFSTLCSLMFELATGVADESLAGAINRFARSEERREIDRDEQSFRYENSDEGMHEREADNFAHVKSASDRLASEAAFWRTMRRARQWDDFALQQIAMRLVYVRDELEIAAKMNGPHFVWASQMGPTLRHEYTEGLHESGEMLLRLAVELGRAVRARRLTESEQK